MTAPDDMTTKDNNQEGAPTMKYRKKPITVEAKQLVGSASETMRVYCWVEENGYPTLYGNANEPDTLRYKGDDDSAPRPTRGIYIDPATGDLVIRTLEGDMRATMGDYIIRGVQGEMYPCKPDIFEATYEKAEDQA